MRFFTLCILLAMGVLASPYAGAAQPDPDMSVPPDPPPTVVPDPIAPVPPSLAPKISPPDTWLPRQGGTLRVLNKLDSTVQTLALHVGETEKLQSLSITLQACDIRPDDLPQDATAHLAVTDTRPEQPGFDGWILQKEPSVNMLEHPVYDIQLAGCT